VKVALVALAGTVTDAGNVRRLAIAPEMATTAPPAGGALLNVTVQVVLVLEDRVEAVHCSEESEETVAAVVSEKVAVGDEPFNEAVIVAL
jgi:hypothetical protein